MNTYSSLPDDSGRSIQVTRKLLQFISDSPTSFHVTANLAVMLAARGFEHLPENQPWNLYPGMKYFVTRNESSLIAFCIPEEPFESFQIAAAHSDSPSFRLKENPEIEAAGHYVQLNVEKYGGAILSPWLDRPLSIAGRVLVRNGHILESCLVNLDRDLVLIPNLAIHMNREVNNGYQYHVQKDLLPVFAEGLPDGSLNRLLAEALDVNEQDILTGDLFLYCRTPGSIWGAHEEFFSSPKLDDLQCAWSIVQALVSTHNEMNVTVACIFDNEEVGSLTKQGASSTFLSDTLQRINAALGRTQEQYHTAVASGFMVSADNAHAVHPQHMDKADLVNRPLMNHGPVIKFSANQKYTTDAVSCSIFREICDIADVPCQTFFNHSDVAGGSTLGNLSNAQVSLNSVDIGLAQLAMHSPYETAGVRDTLYLIQALAGYFNTPIYCEEGRFTIG